MIRRSPSQIVGQEQHIATYVMLTQESTKSTQAMGILAMGILWNALGTVGCVGPGRFSRFLSVSVGSVSLSVGRSVRSVSLGN
jgi:hypothetical protein